MNAQDITNELEKLNITNNNIELDKQSTLPQHISSEWEIDFDHPLGKGNFSDGVYKARKLDGKINGISIPNNGECVVKIVGKKHIDKIGLREVEIIDRLIKLEPCYQVIQFYGYAFGNDGNGGQLCYIYMEYLNGYNSLTEIINKRDNKRLDDEEIIFIVNQILRGLDYIHQYDIIHRDIKCDNILYNGEYVKIIDFGISKYTQIKASTYAGTPTHKAPESINGQTKKSDIWSLGCTIIEMAGGDLTNVDSDGLPIVPDHIHPRIRLGIASFLSKDPFFRHPHYLEEYGMYFYVKKHIIDLNSDKLESSIIPGINQLSLLNFDYKQHLLQSIPQTIKILEIDDAIPSTLIPSHICHIIFRKFNQPIRPDIVPPTVSILELPSFNQPIAPYSIPSSIKALSITSFNHDLEEGSLPETLVNLTLGESFELDKNGFDIPQTIKIFTCLHNFQKQLRGNNNIPKYANYLFLPNYNHPISNGSIPKSVSSLVLGSRYTHFESLSKLPPSVKRLEFGTGGHFNIKTIKNILKYTNNIIKVVVDGSDLRLLLKEIEDDNNTKY